MGDFVLEGINIGVIISIKEGKYKGFESLRVLGFLKSFLEVDWY